MEKELEYQYVKSKFLRARNQIVGGVKDLKDLSSETSAFFMTDADDQISREVEPLIRALINDLGKKIIRHYRGVS